MNDKRDFDRAIDRWLDDGSDATPPEVIDAVLLAARSTPQERGFRIPWRTSPMTYLRLAAVFVTIAVAGVTALYAFGSGPNLGSGPTPDATTQPTLTQPTASAVNPDPPLGAFDLDAFEGRFDVEFSSDVVSTGDILYSADLDSPLGLDFIVDPNDPNNAIIGTAIRSPLPDDNTATEDEWLAFVAETRPDAAAWLTSKRDDYLYAPGAEVSFAQWFGTLCVGFVTGSSVLEPASQATYLYMFVQYEEDCP